MSRERQFESQVNKVAKEAAASAAGGSRQRVDEETMQVVIDKDLLLR